MDPESLFSLSDHLERLSKDGNPLEVLDATIDFEYFSGSLIEGLGYGNGSKGGRPPFDPVSMFKVLIVRARHNLCDARMEFMIRDRLSCMRFFGFDLGGAMPGENTIRHFRNRMTETGTLKRVMKAFDWQLHKKGCIPMPGRIVDATPVPAPGQRNTDGGKAAIEEGKTADEIWPDEPNKAAQKDTDARWTATQAPGRQGQHRLRCLGRQRLPVKEQREMAGPEHDDELHSSRQAHAGQNGQGQCAEIIGARDRRARLWPPEEPLRSVHSHHRHRQGRDQTHAGQPGLQFRPADLP